MSEAKVPVSIPEEALQSLAEALVERYPDVYGYRLHDEPADLADPILARDVGLIARALFDAGWSGPNPEPCMWCEHRRDRHSPGGCHDGGCHCTMPHGGS